MGNELLKRARILQVQATAEALDFGDRREAVLSGWPNEMRSHLPKLNIPRDQLLSDLNKLNQWLPKPGQESLLEIWLETAHHLTKEDPRSAVFQEALKEIRAGRPRKPASKERSLKTTILIDRTTQWTTLLNSCKQHKEHLVFLVHGTEECAPSAFAQRISLQLHTECKPRKHRQAAVVQRSKDGDQAHLALEWQQRFIKATENATGSLGPALLNDAAEACPVYVVLDNDGALQASEPALVLELANFIRNDLSAALSHRKPKHPLRLVIPIEYASQGPGASDLINTLNKMLCEGTALKLVPLAELSFPLWSEVWDWLLKYKKANEKQLADCMNIYRENTHSFIELTTRLHKYFVDLQQ